MVMGLRVPIRGLELIMQGVQVFMETSGVALHQPPNKQTAHPLTLNVSNKL